MLDGLKTVTIGLAFIATAGAQFVQQGGKLLASDASGKAVQGNSVALSADGNPAVIGAPGDAALWVFTRAAGVWTQQARLGSAALGLNLANVGFPVAISANGNTIIAGAPGYNFGAGAAWV